MPLLRRMAQGLAAGPGATIIDLGCGRAGPSLWVARETGASLVGVDLASVGIAQASRRAQELGMADRARFEVGDCTALRFAARTFDAAMSVEVLWMVPDRPACRGLGARGTGEKPWDKRPSWQTMSILIREGGR
jgi:ubiquinone/menaquinone biosynthesis C-methylase UbiE